MRVKCIALFCCILKAVGLYATTAVPAMRHYTLADGLPSTEVHCIFQDSRGKIWFGTDVGVTCYDGTSFRNYTTRDGLSDHTIFGIREDTHGRIWFRTFNGLPCWFDGNKMVQPPVNALLRKALQGDLVVSQELDDHDTLWIGTLYKDHWLKIPPGRTTVIEQQTGKHCALYLKELSPGKLIVAGGIRQGLFFETKDHSKIKLLDSSIFSWPCATAHFPDGRYLIQLRNLRFILKNGNVEMQKDSDVVTFIYPERNGDYWLCGSHPGGTRLVNAGTGQLQQQLLNDYDVTSCLRDHEGGLWFGTISAGVFYIPFPEIHDIYSTTLEKGDRLTTIAPWPGGGIIAGTAYGNLYHAGGGNFEALQIVGDDMRNISAISTLGNTVLICGAVYSAIYNCDTHKTIRLENTLVNPQIGLVLKCAVPYDDDHWCAASIQSLVLIDRQTGAMNVLVKLLPERITCLAKTRGDTLWLGGISRTWMLAPGKAPQDWSVKFPQLFQHMDRLVADPEKNDLWMLSRGSGIFRLTSAGVEDVNQSQPLLPAICRNIVLLDHTLWLGSASGLTQLSANDFQHAALRTYGQGDGFPVSTIEQQCVSGDRIWMTGENILFSFLPGTAPYNHVPPKICFEEIFCNGKKIDDLSSTGKYSYSENTFRFRMAGQTFKSCGHNEYYVRLHGIDEWHTVDESDITYYSLPPGSYTFTAYALNNNHVMSLIPVRFTFAILPPVWKRSWFIITALIFILLVLILLIRNYLRRFRREERYKRTLAELEITAIRAQMNPHFIFNAINSIYNFVQTGDRKASAGYVARFARLIRNVLEFAPLRQVPLEQELETIRLYMDIEQLRFREAFEYEISIAPGLDVDNVQVVPLLLQPYVENAIWHGLLHKKGKGKVTISVRKEKNTLIYVIDDNGIGRTNAAKTKSSDIKKNSLSSLLNKRRLELLRELYGLAFEVQYVDKENMANGETGTQVILHIPDLKNK